MTILLKTFFVCWLQVSGHSTELVNVAPRGRPFQSSGEIPANLAVDGNTETSDGKLCTATNLEKFPYWGVTFDQIYEIDSVRIFFHLNCHHSWSSARVFVLSTFEPHFRNVTTSKLQACGNSRLRIVSVTNVSCGLRGNGILVTRRNLNLDQKILCICEVEVFVKTTNSVVKENSSQESSLPEEVISLSSAVFATPIYSSSYPNLGFQGTSAPSSGDLGRLVNVPATNNVGSSMQPTPVTYMPSSSVLWGTSLLGHSKLEVREILGGSQILDNSAIYPPGFEGTLISQFSLVSQNSAGSCTCEETLHSRSAAPELMSSILVSLNISTRNVSRNRRRYCSVSDNRISSQATGYSAIVMLVIVFGGFILNDLLSLLRFIHHNRA